jgi:hypothetical protein
LLIRATLEVALHTQSSRWFRGALSGALLALPLVLAACGDDSGQGPTPDAGAGTPDATPQPLPELTREQAGGDPGAFVRVGDLGYVTVGPRLTIWDLSDPGAPIERGESEAFDAVLTGVAIVGPNAYVSDRADLDGHVHVIDVSRPAMPMTVATLRIAAEGDFSAPLGIAADATRVFVADQEHGVAVLDVSNPAQPAVTGIIGGGGVTGVQVVGTHLYATSHTFTGDIAFDVYDLGAPGFAHLGGDSVPGGVGLGIGGNDIVVGTGTDGVYVKDLGDPAHPVELLHDGSAVVVTHAIAVGTTVAWLPAADGLYSIDLTLAAPVLSAPTALAVEGGNVALLDGDVLSVVTDRSRLVTVNVAEVPSVSADVNVSLAADAIGVVTSGDQLFVAASASGLRTGRLHDLQPLGRGYQNDVQIDFEDVAVSGTTVYAADWFSGLRVYDVSTPATPKKIGELATGGLPSAIAYADGKVYLGEATNATVLRVIDVSDPTHPKQVGALPTSQIYDLQIVGTRLYSSEGGQGGGGLVIYDVADPTAPKQLGSFAETCDEAHGVGVSGTVAVVGCGSIAQIVDVSNPAAPAFLGTWPISAAQGSIGAVVTDATHAYLGHDRGVTVIDVTTPSQPELVVDEPTAYSVRGLYLPAAGRIVAAAGLGGIYQWKLP